ncbi:MAG: hypothetical protein JWM63_2106 [Gammaproteobacteria bacterium]|nr:hypothetical protein [Gammaproteobacteria bacterium]
MTDKTRFGNNMNRITPSRPVALAMLAALAALVSSAGTNAQAPAQRPAQTPQAATTVDLTGDWVSVVTGDWKFRMVTPNKGVFEGLPLNAEGRRIGGTWDPKQDAADGEQCRAYGAGNIMRVPGRLRIKWESSDTLRIDTDAGTQTRLLKFGPPVKPGEPSWQGSTHAEWHKPAGPAAAGMGGSLKAVTTGLKPGYLRKNGAPYSDATVLTEYYERQTAPNGDSWLIVTQIVKDSKYLSRPYITSANFKKIPDGQGWNPTPCAAN